MTSASLKHMPAQPERPGTSVCITSHEVDVDVGGVELLSGVEEGGDVGGTVPVDVSGVEAGGDVGGTVPVSVSGVEEGGDVGGTVPVDVSGVEAGGDVGGTVPVSVSGVEAGGDVGGTVPVDVSGVEAGGVVGGTVSVVVGGTVPVVVTLLQKLSRYAMLSVWSSMPYLLVQVMMYSRYSVVHMQATESVEQPLIALFAASKQLPAHVDSPGMTVKSAPQAVDVGVPVGVLDDSLGGGVVVDSVGGTEVVD